MLVLEKDGCWLYELYNSHRVNSKKWKADATAFWDMTADERRPYTWTSADAAGLPIFLGLVRYDEVAAGAINHALRFTVPVSQHAFVAPASHWASSVTDPSAPPMGTRAAAQGRLRHFGLFFAKSGDSRGAQTIWHDPGG